MILLPIKVGVVSLDSHWKSIYPCLLFAISGIDLDKDTMKTVYETFGLEPGTQDFIGHSMALYLDDEYAIIL